MKLPYCKFSENYTRPKSFKRFAKKKKKPHKQLFSKLGEQRENEKTTTKRSALTTDKQEVYRQQARKTFYASNDKLKTSQSSTGCDHTRIFSLCCYQRTSIPYYIIFQYHWSVKDKYTPSTNISTPSVSPRT